MVQESYSASAPGTLMLLGEHAVLQDKPAIVLAIDKRITVRLEPRFDQKVIIKSQLGELELDLDKIAFLENTKPFQFVLAAIKYFKKEHQGFELNIESEFSHECGLGSSAAVTVATVAVLMAWLAENNNDKKTLFEISREIIREVQGIASGADVAASVYGGVILYQQQVPYVIKQLDFEMPLVVVYSGSKTPTPEVIQKVEVLRHKFPEVIEALYEATGHAVNKAVFFIENKDWLQLGEVMNIQQGIMNALAVGTPLLNQIIDNLNKEPGIYGAKISGAGLGDCVIALGTGCDNSPQKISLSICKEGLCYG